MKIILLKNKGLGYFMPNGHSPVKGRSGIEAFFQKDMADGVSSAQVNYLYINFLILISLNLNA